MDDYLEFKLNNPALIKEDWRKTLSNYRKACTTLTPTQTEEAKISIMIDLIATQIEREYEEDN